MGRLVEQLRYGSTPIAKQVNGNVRKMRDIKCLPELAVARGIQTYLENDHE